MIQGLLPKIAVFCPHHSLFHLPKTTVSNHFICWVASMALYNMLTLVFLEFSVLVLVFWHFPMENENLSLSCALPDFFFKNLPFSLLSFCTPPEFFNACYRSFNFQEIFFYPNVVFAQHIVIISMRLLMIYLYFIILFFFSQVSFSICFGFCSSSSSFLVLCWF